MKLDRAPPATAFPSPFEPTLGGCLGVGWGVPPLLFLGWRFFF